MWGAIIGDFAGSIYEYEQSKNISVVEVKELITNSMFFSDDTILTIAILDAILNEEYYEKYLKLYAKMYMEYKPNFTPYFKYPFSPGFIKWAKGNNEGLSRGNGAMMRISPIGYLFDNEDIIKNEVIKATIPSHNSKEAIDCTTIIALIIYYARKGYSKEEIINKLNLKFEYKEFKKFNMTCYETIDNCLNALFTTNNYEEAIRKVISYGGDTDTNACIVGSMAEAMYGTPYDLVDKVKDKLPKSFAKKLDCGYERIKHY